MRIIVRKRLREYASRHPTASAGLSHFEEVALAAAWKSFAELKATYNHADQCKSASGRILQIINIQGNNYRLIVHIHFHAQRIYIREFLSHTEYSKEVWKERH